MLGLEPGESLQALERDRWNSLLEAAARALSDDTRSRLAALVSSPLGGAEPAALIMSDLYTVGFSLGKIAEAASSELQAEDASDAYRMSIKRDDVPVRKTFADWILFRKAATGSTALLRRRSHARDRTGNQSKTTSRRQPRVACEDRR
jgi:hypothetical protein